MDPLAPIMASSSGGWGRAQCRRSQGRGQVLEHPFPLEQSCTCGGLSGAGTKPNGQGRHCAIRRLVCGSPSAAPVQRDVDVCQRLWCPSQAIHLGGRWPPSAPLPQLLVALRPPGPVSQMPEIPPPPFAVKGHPATRWSGRAFSLRNTRMFPFHMRMREGGTALVPPLVSLEAAGRTCPCTSLHQHSTHIGRDVPEHHSGC